MKRILFVLLVFSLLSCRDNAGRPTSKHRFLEESATYARIPSTGPEDHHTTEYTRHLLHVRPDLLSTDDTIRNSVKGDMLVTNNVIGIRLVVPALRVAARNPLDFVTKTVHGLRSPGLLNVRIKCKPEIFSGNANLAVRNARTVWPPLLAGSPSDDVASKVGLHAHRSRFLTYVTLNRAKSYASTPARPRNLNSVLRKPTGSVWKIVNPPALLLTYNIRYLMDKSIAFVRKSLHSLSVNERHNQLQVFSKNAFNHRTAIRNHMPFELFTGFSFREILHTSHQGKFINFKSFYCADIAAQ